MNISKKLIAKPFLKWAGGKTQLLNEIKKNLPSNFNYLEYTFIEPFVGSGAVMFWILSKYPNIKNVIINDVNTDLTNCYKIIKSDVDNLISLLFTIENEYHQLPDDIKKRKEYYYQKRALFNKRNSSKLIQSALFIFLNRTCFNGLYRVNRKNEFNVPIGSYKKPQICNAENLKAVSEILQKVKILNGDYSETIKYTTKNTLFYFDPPYKPLSKTSSFNAYAKHSFDDKEQIRLKEFCELLNKEKHLWILSNSDVKGIDKTDNFFDNLYHKFNIFKVETSRMINPHIIKKNKVTELLISNI